MAVQQTVQIIGNSNNTIAQITTVADAMLQTPDPCSLQSSLAVGVVIAGGVNLTTDSPIFALQWTDSFTNCLIKKVRAGFGISVAGTAGVYTFKLFRATNFYFQYNTTSGTGPVGVSTPYLRSGQVYQGLFQGSAPLVRIDDGLGSAGMSGATLTLDPNPLAVIAYSKRAVAGQTAGFNAGGIPSNMGMQSLWEITEGDYPIYLQKGEGIVITSSVQSTTALATTVSMCFDAVPVVNQEY